MKIDKTSIASFLIIAFLPGVLCCASGSGSSSRKVLGGVRTTNEEARAPLPHKAPSMIYVADFALEAQDYSGDKGVRGSLPGGLGKRLPHPMARGSSSDKAHRIVDTMAESLVKDLGEKGLPAQRLRDTSGELPREGWLAQGVFTEVGEGSRIKRAIIGFGSGATSMDLQLGISDLASSEPRAPFLVFGTVKDPNKVPGAVVTMNPYVAVAKFVLAKNATEKDVKKTAAQIAGEIAKYAQPEHGKPTAK